VDLELDKVRKRLTEQQVSLEMTEEAKGYVADQGYDPHFGARPLRRVIQNRIEDVLSEGILAGTYQAGDTVLADYQDGTINMKIIQRAEPAAAIAEPEAVT
jgi:ATP-dependent Clp protease ATP-binding subunit ClpA